MTAETVDGFPALVFPTRPSPIRPHLPVGAARERTAAFLPISDVAAEIPSGAGIIAPRHPAVLHDVI